MCTPTKSIMTAFALILLAMSVCILYNLYNIFEPNLPTAEKNILTYPPSIAEIQQRMEELNKLQTVLNENIFGPSFFLVIVVQVHNRILYLRHLIESLKLTKGIENALVVFSHDYYDEEINLLIRNIQFCKVIQIFFPYSLQTHPKTFPGDSPRDCPPNIGRQSAIEINCTNALYPDVHGTYRKAKFTQLKHHFWWKINQIFDHLNTTRNFDGFVIFLEDDMYVAPDLIHMLRLMMGSTRNSQCSDCKVLVLGFGDPITSFNFAMNSGNAQITHWTNSFGMAFNRSVWNAIKACAQTFCKNDDYNSDWSLLAVNWNCLHSGKYRALELKAKRIFHIGDSGTHFINTNSSSTRLLDDTKILLKEVKNDLFPDELRLERVTEIWPMKQLIINGGWADIRDHNLCLAMSNTSTS